MRVRLTYEDGQGTEEDMLSGLEGAEEAYLVLCEMDEEENNPLVSTADRPLY
jgi:hypothetical protein